METPILALSGRITRVLIMCLFHFIKARFVLLLLKIVIFADISREFWLSAKLERLFPISFCYTTQMEVKSHDAALFPCGSN